MDRTVTAADANRGFSKLLREVQGGDSFIITAHGRPVARIVPFDEDEAARIEARRVHLARLASKPTIEIGPWTREELYDD
jgi:prevent-host-death family protein